MNIPEINVIRKNWTKTELKVALCYPNHYRAGISSLALQLLYYLVNNRDDSLCERFFFMAKDPKAPLSIESHKKLIDFDIITFTIHYETDYINLVTMLLKSGIPPFIKDRKKTHPKIIAGGPIITANPMPMADIIDNFFLGELEPSFDLLQPESLFPATIRLFWQIQKP